MSLARDSLGANEDIYFSRTDAATQGCQAKRSTIEFGWCRQRSFQ